jgi:drug/metabolite transporter (DMT)-like permease
MAGGAVLFLVFMALRRIPIPRGHELLGVIAFGAVQFGLGFGLGYWALVKVPASVAGTMLAALPLFTLAIAAATRVEPMTLRGVAGSLISIGGIVVLLGGRANAAIPVPRLLAMMGFVLCLAAGLVIAKALPHVHPAALNGIGMLVGTVILLVASVVLGEPKPLPALSLTWAVQLYVVVVGSVGVFSLIIFVLRRWTASATSYQTVLSPPVTIMLAALLLGEPISPGLVVGAAIIVVGVYVGVISHWHLPSRRAGQARI